MKILRVKDKYLISSNEADKKIYHITLENIDIDYEPGDIIKIYPKNSNEDIQKISRLLNISNISNKIKEKLSSLDLNRANISFLEEIAKYDEDILKINSSFMQRHNYILKNSVLDILEKINFSSSDHNIDKILNTLSKIRGRSYSIASSKKYINDIDLMIAIETFSVDNIKRMGLASKYVDCLGINDSVEVECIPNEKFRLPKNCKKIFMIGAGTGLAPFIGFLQNIDKDIKSWLLLGTPKNIYYQDFLNRMIREKNLKFDVAISRENSKYQYVQDIIINKKDEVRSFVLDKESYIYICGSKKMGYGVEEAFINILDENIELSKEILSEMKKSGRYRVDVY